MIENKDAEAIAKIKELHETRITKEEELSNYKTFVRNFETQEAQTYISDIVPLIEEYGQVLNNQEAQKTLTYDKLKGFYQWLFSILKDESKKGAKGLCLKYETAKRDSWNRQNGTIVGVRRKEVYIRKDGLYFMREGYEKCKYLNNLSEFGSNILVQEKETQDFINAISLHIEKEEDKNLFEKLTKLLFNISLKESDDKAFFEIEKEVDKTIEAVFDESNMMRKDEIEKIRLNGENLCFDYDGNQKQHRINFLNKSGSYENGTYVYKITTKDFDLQDLSFILNFKEEIKKMLEEIMVKAIEIDKSNDNGRKILTETILPYLTAGAL